MANDTDQIISDIIDKEGPATNDPNDHGGRTEFGISEAANPEAWADGKVTREEAEAIYKKKYIEGPGFDKVPFPPVESLLVDWGVTSGPGIAILALQHILGVDADGAIGPDTAAAVQAASPDNLVRKLVAERVKMIGRIVTRSPSQLKYLNGWLARAVEWL